MSRDETAHELERLLADARARDEEGVGRHERLIRHVAAAGFVAAAAAFAAVVPSDRSASLVIYAAFVAAYALASRVEFEVGSGLALPTQLVLVPMLFALPAPTVPVVVALGLVASALPDVYRQRSADRAVSAVSSSWFSLGPAAVFAVAGEPAAAWGAAGVVLLALLAQFAADALSSSLSEWAAIGLTPTELFPALLWAFTIDTLLTPVGFGAAFLERAEPAAPLLCLPLIVLLALFARERTERFDHMLALSSAYRGTAFLLGDVIEADDQYTGDHSHEVVSLAVAVADRLGLKAKERRDTELAALLHDVGKIRIPDSIINKPGPLTREERAIVNTHTMEGQRLLEKVGGLLGDIGLVVRSCHEHYDGGGYPDGLAGEQIPLVARIVGCCDAYNAMTTTRSYRAALTPTEAAAELYANRGTQFDPDIVDALVAVIAAGMVRTTGRTRALALA